MCAAQSDAAAAAAAAAILLCVSQEARYLKAQAHLCSAAGNSPATHSSVH